MGDYVLEACVDRVESAVIATEAGANRLELCSNLMIGGTTPTLATFRQVRKECKNEVRVLLRPRFGDFLYSESEFSILKEEVIRFREEGADGIVIGILKENGDLDIERMKGLISLAGTMKITLHRAFDVCKDPFRTMEEAIRLGIDTILTSGQASTATKGLVLLKELQECARGRIHLLAGSGVTSSVISEIYKETGITDYHLSGKTVLDSGMKYRKDGVPMGLPAFSEYEILQTEESKIRDAAEVLKSLLHD